MPTEAYLAEREREKQLQTIAANCQCAECGGGLRTPYGRIIQCCKHSEHVGVRWVWQKHIHAGESEVTIDDNVFDPNAPGCDLSYWADYKESRRRR